jgi:hypothetical protein
MRSRYIAFAIAFLPVLVHAQNRPAGENSLLESIAVTVIPIFLVAFVIYFFFARHVKSGNKYVERHEQHMTRVEYSLERIANALEKKDSQ